MTVIHFKEGKQGRERQQVEKRVRRRLGRETKGEQVDKKWHKQITFKDKEAKWEIVLKGKKLTKKKFNQRAKSGGTIKAVLMPSL